MFFSSKKLKHGLKVEEKKVIVRKVFSLAGPQMTNETGRERTRIGTPLLNYTRQNPRHFAHGTLLTKENLLH